MNATNRPVDILLNTESPSINLAKRRDLGRSTGQDSDLSALNRKDNSFDDVYRQQRREGNEARQAEQQKRSDDAVSRNEHRSQQAQQAAAVKQTRTETKTNTDGKALPPQTQNPNGKKETAQVAQAGVVAAETENQSVALEEMQGEDIIVNLDVTGSTVKEGEVAGYFAGLVEDKKVESDAEIGDDNVAQEPSEPDAVLIAQNQQTQAAQQAVTSQTADVATSARAAQVAGVAAEVAREFKQTRLGEAIENAGKVEVNTATKSVGSGAEQSGQQMQQDRSAQFSGGMDFKLLREQLAANTVKVDTSSVSAAKGASVEAAPDGDAQPRLNALTQTSQALGQAKAGVVSASVQTPVNSADWGQAMSQRIMWLVNRGISAAELQLNPRDLGPVDVRISVTGEHTTVHFSSQHAAVRDVLESNVVRLREMLESSGLDLADVNVSDQSHSEQAQTNDRDASGGAGTAENDGFENSDGSVITQTIESDGLVDFYA